MHHNAVKQFEEIKSTHKKVKHIKHNKSHKLQDYITRKIFTNNMVSTLFNLRSRCENELKENFHNQNTNMDCFICKSVTDCQEHALTYAELRKHLRDNQRQILASVQYSDIFGSLDQQIKIKKIYQTLIKTRRRLREKMDQEQA